MDYVSAGGIELVEGIRAGFSTRAGGVSGVPFRSLNLSYSSGDVRDVVTENRRLLSEPLGFSVGQIAIAGLVHGNDVAVVTEPGLVNDVDGLVTTVPDLLLCVTAADCAVVLLADPVRRVIGACHAGWRGAVGGVVRKTVDALVSLGGTTAEIRAFVSPCISKEHFEVGPEVADQFDSAFVSNNSETGKQHVDLRAALRAQLIACGLADSFIDISDECTARDTHKYFSYRAEKGQTGRMMGFIGMSE